MSSQSYKYVVYSLAMYRDIYNIRVWNRHVASYTEKASVSMIYKG